MSKRALGDDVNMMPGFMVIGMACFAMPYGANEATWVEVDKSVDTWDEIRPTRSTVQYSEKK